MTIWLLKVIQYLSRKVTKAIIDTKKKGHEKIGICLECEKKNLHKELKMKNGNTTGIKKHFMSIHNEVYRTTIEGIAERNNAYRQSSS